MVAIWLGLNVTLMLWHVDYPFADDFFESLLLHGNTHIWLNVTEICLRDSNYKKTLLEHYSTQIEPIIQYQLFSWCQNSGEIVPKHMILIVIPSEQAKNTGEPLFNVIFFSTNTHKRHPVLCPYRQGMECIFVSLLLHLYRAIVIVVSYVILCYNWPFYIEFYLFMGQVMKVGLSCYLVLLSVDSKTGNKTSAPSWPDPYGNNVNDNFTQLYYSETCL